MADGRWPMADWGCSDAFRTTIPGFPHTFVMGFKYTTNERVRMRSILKKR
ncbi:hypothetical protein MNBD_ACTINO01-1416, partial [hydrothermal vent metagenome]